MNDGSTYYNLIQTATHWWEPGKVLERNLDGTEINFK